MGKRNFFSAILFIILAGIVFADSRGLDILPIGPGTFPALLSLLLFVLSGVLIFKSFSKTSRDRLEISWPGGEGIRTLAFVGSTTAFYLLLMYPLGYLLSTVVFITAMFQRLSTYRWYKSILLAVVISGGTFWMFQKFGLSLPRGILKGLYF
jgi:hypothetical protein